MVTAERTSSGEYAIHPPEAVGEVHTLITRLQAQAGAGQSVLLGFDFPIGLPRHYAHEMNLKTLRSALPKFGRGEWGNFFELSNTPSRYQPFSPLDSKTKGSKTALTNALGGSLDHVKRRCEREARAETLFFTMGAKQVGRGAIVGWRDVIRPALDQVKIWPFDGELVELIQQPGVTIAEIYPGAAYAPLGIVIGKLKRKKSKQEHRAAALAPLTTEWPIKHALLDGYAKRQFADGFATEDDFDAMVGVLSMLQVVCGGRPSGEPRGDRAATDIEGWILGLQHSTKIP